MLDFRLDRSRIKRGDQRCHIIAKPSKKSARLLTGGFLILPFVGAAVLALSVTIVCSHVFIFPPFSSIRTSPIPSRLQIPILIIFIELSLLQHVVP